MQESFQRLSRRNLVRPIVIGSLILAAGSVLALHYTRGPQAPPSVEPVPLPGGGDDVGPQVTAFCGNCHGTPSPAGFPKGAWHEEVKKGYDFYFDSGRTDLAPPNISQVVAWFRNQAPDEIVIPPAVEGPAPRKLRFRKTDLALSPEGRDADPAVSFAQWCALSADQKRVLLWCDMRSGNLVVADGRWPEALPSLIGKAAHPAHAEPCDLDGDGRVDLVVAELGSFLPADHADGKVLWLRRTAEGGWQPGVLQAGLGRVADVQPGDFDGDGDVDLVVAEFGWRKTGRIVLLENLGNQSGEPAFQLRELDSRHGTIHVPTVDLDGDGRLDFVALISQEHETVVAFLNDGAGGFRRETIFAANEPAFGSSGIQLVDLDGDGDLDVLYSNGDTFDSFYPKPFHSLRWLENRGTFPFEDHFLAAMTGVQKALATDLDGDGDLDIVACALLPERFHSRQPKSEFDSLIWLEQTRPGTFERHNLERGVCEHAALEAGDFDGDGDIDLAVGRFANHDRAPSMTVWWNLRVESRDRGDR
jgi:hypothetical protein